MRLFTILALSVAVGLAAGVSPYASSSPDGLERVAADQGFLERGKVQESSVLSDYAVPGVADERLATGLAGFAGTLLVFGTGFAIVVAARRRVPA